MAGIEDFIQRLPKAELHLHLEGTILPSTLVELSTRHDGTPLTQAEAEALYRFDDFTSFIESFKAVTRRLIGPEDYELVAWRMIERPGHGQGLCSRVCESIIGTFANPVRRSIVFKPSSGREERR